MELKQDELLIVIDPQKDFINVAGDYAQRHSGINQILTVRDRINRLLKSIDRNKVVIVYSNYAKDQFGVGRSMCIPATFGHEIDLDLDGSFTLIPKTQHSCFSSKQFLQYIKTNNINRLILCGFLAEYCVRQTALDGLSLGYDISLLEEYVATGDDVQERIAQLLNELLEKGGKVNSYKA